MITKERLQEESKLIGYNWRFYKIIQQFIEDERLDILEHCLNDLERDIRERFNYSDDKTLWFRLFEDDTLVTDIQTIKAHYRYNKKTLMRELKNCIKDASVKLKFS